MKKQIFSVAAALMAVFSLGVTALADISDVNWTEKWISDDETTEYAALFKDYVGEENFDENSFFISKFEFDTKYIEEQRAYDLIVSLSTNSEIELKILPGMYQDQSLVPRPEVHYRYFQPYSVIDDSMESSVEIRPGGSIRVPWETEDVISISKDNAVTLDYTPFISESVALSTGIFGYQVLNSEEVKAGTTITVTYTARDSESVQTTIDTITYTFTGTEWVTATDAGYYLVGDTQYGVMRFLFKSNIEGEITESGIKYINGSDVTDYIDNTTIGRTGTASAFYGDITDIPDGDTGTYYAVAYVTTDDGQTHWSDVVSCTPDFTNRIDYGGASE